MLSRVANNLFWIGRYMERSYGILLTTRIGFSEAQNFENQKIENNNLVIEEVNTAKSVNTILFDSSDPNSIFNIAYKTRENARSIQEQISRELWLCINKQYLFLRNNSAIKSVIEDEDPLKILDELLNMNALYYGIADLTQERGSPYCFMNCGKYIERIFRNIDFLDKNFIRVDKNSSTGIEDSVYWKNLLLSIGGYQLFLRTYKSVFDIDNIFEMLISNTNFPHSIYYAVKKLETHLSRLNIQNNKENNELLFLIGKLESKLKYTKLSSIKEIGFDNFIKSAQNDISEISMTFNKYYFSNY